MPKRREPKATGKTPSQLEDQIKQFADAADQHKDETTQPDPDAPRKYKAIRVPFNEYEYELLDKAAKQARRSKLDFIRLAIQSAAEQQEN